MKSKDGRTPVKVRSRYVNADNYRCSHIRKSTNPRHFGVKQKKIWVCMVTVGLISSQYNYQRQNLSNKKIHHKIGEEKLYWLRMGGDGVEHSTVGFENQPFKI